MAKLATDSAALTRICEFARRLHQLRRLGGEDAIEREFNAVCRAIWGFTLDDFTDDDHRNKVRTERRAESRCRKGCPRPGSLIPLDPVPGDIRPRSESGVECDRCGTG